MLSCSRWLLAFVLLTAEAGWAQEPDAGLTPVSDRADFNTNSDRPDIYQSRVRPYWPPRQQQQSKQDEPALMPPLPVRANGRASPLLAEADLHRREGRYREAEPLLRRAAEMARRSGRDRPETAAVLQRLAWIEQALGRYKEAEPLYKEALAILEKASGPEHPDMASCLHDLATLYLDMKREADAEPLARRALAIREKALGVEHPATAESLDTIGYLHMARRELAEAEAPVQRSLAIREKAFGPEHLDTATGLARMAGLRHMQERISEAEPFARRALAIREKALGPEHPDLAISLERMAGLNVHKKQYDEALSLAKRVLAIREKALGPEHPRTLDFLDKMGGLYMLRRELDAAEASIRRALEARQRNLSPDHPDLAASFDSLATLNVYRFDDDAVASHYRRALAIREKAFGPEDPRLVETLMSLGKFVPDLAEGDALFMRAVTIQEKAHGASHPKTIETYTTLLSRYRQKQRFAEAGALAERLLANAKAQGGGDNPALVKVLDEIAEFYAPDFSMRPEPREADAEPLLRQALAIREKVLGADHPEIAKRAQRLARLLERLRKIDDAEQFFKRAVAITEKVHGPQDGQTAMLVAALAHFYKENGRLAEAEKQYLRYVAMSETMLQANSRNYDIGSRLRELSEVYAKQNRSAEMESIYQKFISIIEAKGRADREDGVFAVEMLADFYYDQKRLADAERLYLKVLAIYEKETAAEKDKAAGARFDYIYAGKVGKLEELYQKEKRHADIAALYKRALARAESVHGQDSPSLIPLLGKLESYLGSLEGSHEGEREAVLKRVLAIVEKDKGPDHANSVPHMERLAQFYMDTDRDGDAEPLLKRVVAIAEKSENPGANRATFNFSEVENKLQKLGTFYANQKRYAEARAIYGGRLEAVEKKHGSDDYRAIEWLVRLGELSEKQGDHAQAESLLKRAAAIEQKSLLSATDRAPNERQAFSALRSFYETHERRADLEAFLKSRFAVEEEAFLAKTSRYLSSSDSLFNLYQQQKRYAEAESILKRELALREKVLGERDNLTRASLLGLARFYSRLDRDAEALALYERIHKIQEKTAGPKSREALDTLNNIADAQMALGRYGEAERIYKDLLVAYEESARPDILWFFPYERVIEGLERLYKGTGRAGEIEPLYARAMPLIESKVLAPAGRNVIETHKRGVEFYRGRYRYAEAERVAKRWLALKEAEKNDIALLEPLTVLGSLYERQANYAEAEKLLVRAVAIAQAAYGAESAQAVDAMLSLAELYRQQGRLDEAEKLNLSVLAIEEAALAKAEARSANNRRNDRGSKQRFANTLRSLALLRQAQERFSEAEETLKRVVDLNLQVGQRVETTGIYSLGLLYLSLGRQAEAEPLLRRVLNGYEAWYGSGHVGTIGPVHSLGDLYRAQGRHAEAEPLLQQAATMSEKVNGPAHPITLRYLDSLAWLRHAQGRHAEAETLFRRVLEGREKAFGAQASATLFSLYDLLNHYLERDQLDAAEPIARRLEALIGKTRQSEEFEKAIGIFLLARYEEKRGRIPEAFRLRKDAAAILIAQARRQTAGLAGEGPQDAPGLRRNLSSLISLVRGAAQMARLEPERKDALGAEVFEMPQWARHSQAAAALAQMSARFAKGDGELARLVRRKQDLVAQFKALDRDLLVHIAKESEDVSWRERRAQRDKIWAERARIEKAVQEVDARLRVEFPDYAALANPEPLSLAQTQAQLKPGEALYQVVLGEENAYAWVVTKDAMRWDMLPASGKTIAVLVEALRCGLDSSAWSIDLPVELHKPGTRPVAQAGGQPQPDPKLCAELLGQAKPGRVLPFDVTRAHELYKHLFAPFEDMIRDKHLLVVPVGALAALPLHVLVTEAPDPALEGEERYAKAAWLALRQPVTVLPSVASLKALRAASRETAGHPYSGFGNPLLEGIELADRSAWTKTECAAQVASLGGGALPVQKVALASAEPALPRGGLQQFYRGGLADVKMIRQQEPLPETADELCAVAAALGGTGADVHLGAKASEANLKAMSKEGRLGRSRVVHFATHGLIGGETEILTRSRLEPALIMTPPDAPSDEDDGLLTASEAAALSLNADLVILSACNTAAGDGKTGGEALSGLARAFLYAGSRALLASHWYVNSQAAVELVTGTFAETAQSPGIGRAEALRRAMASRIAAGGYRAHPSYWAPFVLVGEGA